MPEESSTNLDNILKVERNKRKKLVPLEDDFYKKVADQIHELEEEKRKIEDPYSTKYAMIEDGLKTTRKAIESIIYNRTTKIINEARHNAEISLLYGPHAQKEDLLGMDSMTKEELAFYNQLLELMTSYRTELKRKIFDRGKDGYISVSSVAQEKKKKEASSEDKKDIRKEYMMVRLLKDIPTFVGADGRIYTLAKEDIAVLSTVNAKALINRNAAIPITVKR